MTERWLARLDAATGAGLEDELERLSSGLVRSAEESGVLDLAFSTMPSPIGELLLVASERGVVRVAFEIEDHATVLADLAARLSPRILRAPDRLARATSELEEYFARRRRRFDVPVDLGLTRGFRAQVVASLGSIEFGRTMSYAELAGAVGNPGAVRAVGTACATNPVPLLMPCHRVVRSDGSFGAYRGGHEAKKYLLEMELAA